MARLRNRLAYPLLVAALLTAAVMVRYVDPFFVQALRLLAFDLYQRLDPGTYDPALPIRVVDIDEQSLAKIGQWPWPRTTLAKLVQNLTAQGAAAIAFDILFAEPDANSLEQVAQRLPPAQSQLLAAAVRTQPTNDQTFAAALKDSPSVLSVELGQGPRKTLPAKAGFATAGDNPRQFVPNFDVASGDLPELEQAASGIGAFNWLPDRDQIVRRVPLMFRLGSALVPSLDAEALRVAQGASSYVIKSSNASGETAYGQSSGLNHIRIGSVDVPTDSTGAVYLRFRHFNASHYLPAWKVLAGQIDPNEIRGRIILVGTSASGLLDLRATPVDESVPGVDVHAQVLEHLVTGEFLTRPDYAVAFEEFVILVFGIALAIVMPRVSAKYAALIGLLAIGFVIGGGWALYRYADLLFDPSYPALVLGIMASGITFYTYQTVDAQRGQIRSAFSRYLAPAVVEEAIAHPEKLQLGGQQRELTLLFCDVRNFTSISERLSATELTNFINELLTPLSEIILEQRGTIDKYMGDAIMAFWNAPVDDPAHRAHACSAAIAMAKKMDDLNKAWREKAEAADRPFQRVRIGIGLNSGECCVGNLGSTMRFDYSAIGDEVNVTSRFEGLTKIYGISAVVGERAIGPDLAVLELDHVQVKGRSRAEKIYTFLDLLRGDELQIGSLQKNHKAFLEAYRQQKWDEATGFIAACRNVGISELDSYYTYCESRIRSMRLTPLPSNWDGSFEMVEK
jgi:adenylate cyclase